MLTTLCETCFPAWGSHEVKTIAPLTLCEQCGKGDARAHLFATDPRGPVVAQHLACIAEAGTSGYLARLSRDQPEVCLEMLRGLLTRGVQILSIELSAPAREETTQ